MRKIILYIVFIISLAYLVREILYIGLRSHKEGEFDKLNTIFEKHNEYNTLIIGSSRAESHFNPEVIDSIDQVNSYNIGLEGNTLPMALAVFEAYLVNSKTPKNVILNLDYYGVKENMDIINNFPKYFAYLDNPKLYEKLKERDPDFLFYKWLPFYSLPYMQKKYLSISFRGFFKVTTPFDQSFIKGFVPIPKETAVDPDTLTYTPYQSLPKRLIYESLDSIIHIARSRQIKLFFVISPMFHKQVESTQNREAFVSTLKRIAQDKQIPFFDYSLDEITMKKELFCKPKHLNKKGADLFSYTFAKDLRQYLSK